MLRQLSRSVNVVVERYLPESFILAILLTLATMAAALGVGSTPGDVLGYWYGGFWNFLEFTTQMILILVTGYALVKAPPVMAIIDRAAGVPRTQGQAIVILMLFSAAAAYISWGLGFVFGALFSVEIAKRLPAADFRILVAASYTAAIAVIPASITVTAPLLVNTPGHSLEAEIGLVPLGQTIFSPTMLLIVGLSLPAVIAAFLLMAPKPDAVQPLRLADGDEEPEVDEGPLTVAERIGRSRLITAVTVALGLGGAVLYFVEQGFNLDLNILNFMFIFLGVGLHGTVGGYLDALRSGMGSATGIIIQFPFYGGIMGIAGGAGLVTMTASAFATIASAETFPVLAYISAALVNIVVPSAGGQWLLQGPVLVETAAQVGVSPAMAVNALTVGDMTTNLLQPFFVLPTLGIAGLGLKDLWGYCMIALVVLTVIAGSVFFLVPHLGW